jgi:hypothetical protein
MKNTLFTLFILLPVFVFGQVEQPPILSPEKRKELEGMKVAYLTNKMDLSPEEAQVFWPVYNQYRDEIDAHREKGRKKYQVFKINQSVLTDEEIEEHLAFKFDHDREAIDIEEKYIERFTEILSPQKVVALLEAEEGFKRELLKRIRGERQQGRRR